MKLRQTTLAVIAVATLLCSASAWAGNGQNLLQHTPASSNIVISLDLDQLRASPLYQMIWGMIASGPDAQEVLADMETQAGFDPNRDLSTMLISLTGDDDRFAFLIEGSFNVDQIAAFLGTLDPTEMATMQYAGNTVYHDPSETGADKAYFSFINNNLMAVGTQDDLSAVLDVLGGTGAAMTTNEQLSGLCSTADTSGVFWFCGVMTPTMQAQMVGTPMAGMTNMYGSGNLTGGLNLQYVLGTNTEAEATAMGQFLQTSLSEARTQPEIAQMGLGGILDAVAISNTGSNVAISVAVPEQTLNQIVGMLTAIMAAQGMSQQATPPAPTPEPVPEQAPPQ